MPKSLRLLLAVVAGLVLGSAVNLGLVWLGGQVVPPPPGTDATGMAGSKAAAQLLEARHLVFPFLAHALGTLVGALVACRLAPGRSPVAAWIVAGVFLAGGIVNAVLLPVPAWFISADLLLAYLPVAWLGQSLARRRSGTGGGAP